MDRAWRQAGSAAVRRIPGPFATVVFSNNITLKLFFYFALIIIKIDLLIIFAEKGWGVGQQDVIIKKLIKGGCIHLSFGSQIHKP